MKYNKKIGITLEISEPSKPGEREKKMTNGESPHCCCSLNGQKAPPLPSTHCGLTLKTSSGDRLQA